MERLVVILYFVSMVTVITLKYWDRQAWVNSVEPNQMLQNALSEHGLHSLPLI